MICAHCGLPIEPAETLPNGSRYRHTTTGWRSCFYKPGLYAETETTGEHAA